MFTVRRPLEAGHCLPVIRCSCARLPLLPQHCALHVEPQRANAAAAIACPGEECDLDIRHFEALQRVIMTGYPRRRLPALLAMLPLVGGLLGGLALDEAGGHGRRKRRKRRHRHGKGRRRTQRKRRKLCKGCEGCCDSSRMCQPGTTNAACGSASSCAICTGQEQCQDQTCVCVPECGGTCDGTADGCGGTCTNCPAGRVCLSNGTCAIPCPGGGPDCATAGCASTRCIVTNEGNVCSLGNGEGSCQQDNQDCPVGRACSGTLCEVIC